MDSGQGDDGDPDDEVSPLLRLNLDCLYYNIDDMVKFTQLGNNYKYTSIHLNIHSLPSKYDQLRTMIANLEDIGIIIHFIMLCETFLMDSNKDMFPLPGHQFICNNRVYGRGGGVAFYVRDIFRVNIRNDLTINHGVEFESIFCEARHNEQKLIVGGSSGNQRTDIGSEI